MILWERVEPIPSQSRKGFPKMKQLKMKQPPLFDAGAVSFFVEEPVSLKKLLKLKPLTIDGRQRVVR